jgi:hypothetical protein
MIQVVDEMIFQFKHTIEMDRMLPRIAVTGKHVKVPLVVIVRFCDGRLAHEHICWDQPSVLAQIALLAPAKLRICGVESASEALNPKLPASTDGARDTSTSVGRDVLAVFEAILHAMRALLGNLVSGALTKAAAILIAHLYAASKSST